jgi:hypothetical protein
MASYWRSSLWSKRLPPHRLLLLLPPRHLNHVVLRTDWFDLIVGDPAAALDRTDVRGDHRTRSWSPPYDHDLSVPSTHRWSRAALRQVTEISTSWPDSPGATAEWTPSDDDEGKAVCTVGSRRSRCRLSPAAAAPGTAARPRATAPAAHRSCGRTPPAPVRPARPRPGPGAPRRWRARPPATPPAGTSHGAGENGCSTLSLRVASRARQVVILVP